MHHSLFPWLCHLTFSLSSPTCHLFLSPIPSPDPSPDPLPIPIAHFLIRLFHIQSCVTPAGVAWCTQQWALPDSLQIHWATAPELWDELSPWLLSPSLASSMSQPYVLVNFMIQHIFILQIIPYMFHPLSIRLTCCVQTFLEILMYNYSWT